MQEKPLILPFTWYLGSGWGQSSLLLREHFGGRVGGGFQPPFGSVSNFFFLRNKKISFYPKAPPASIQPRVHFFCRLLNMLPLRSYTKTYFLSVRDKLKPGKLPCNFFYFDSPVGKRHLQLSGYSWELLHRRRKGVKSRFAAPTEDGGGGGVSEGAGPPLPV